MIEYGQDIAGQIVLITGGGSGIGRLMCLKLVMKKDKDKDKEKDNNKSSLVADLAYWPAHVS